MGRAIEVVFQGEATRLVLERVTRDRLYGHAQRIGLDAAGRECASALLTRDGRFVLGPGGTAGLYLDDRGDVVARENLAATDEDNAQSTSSTAEPGPVEMSGPVPAEALLAHTATAVYVIDGLDPTGPLTAALAAGDIFRVSASAFGSRYTGRFLLSNEHGAFLIAAESVTFEFVGHDSPLPIEDDPDGSDDLGFGELGDER